MRKYFLLMMGIIVLISFPSSYAQAFSWGDLWSRPDRQGAQLLAAEDPGGAAEQFTDPDWRGVAYYRADQYEQAAEDFARGDNALNFYNLGNALAKFGQYQAAIDAYEAALTRDPNNADASYNRDLIEELLQQQQDQPQSSDEQQSDNEQDQSQQSDEQTQADQEAEQPQNEPAAQPDQAAYNEEQAAASVQQQEQQQSQEQWLRQVPDEPGGLLQQKFLRDHLRRQRAGS